jgi:protein arginine kinase activator
MKCDVCRKMPAVIFVQQVSRGSSIELHLCEECALERGFSTTENKIDVSLGGIFSGILDGSSNHASGLKACPLCRLTFADIRKLHKTGCAECYRHFSAEIVSLLRSEGIEISYTGELPPNSDAFKSPDIDPENLKKELQRAIEQEDYEMAAYYRDRLRSLGGAK